MVNRIQYNDFDGNLTEVIWGPASGVDPTDDYVTRVERDGGAVEAVDCLRDAINALGSSVEVYEFDCATQTPLVYRWHGERYTNICGSEITWGIIIKNDADRAQTQALLNGGYYVQVRKNGAIKWYGKVFPQFFTEAYRQYPYTLELNAADQLGQLKGYQLLMIDFPDPHDVEAPRYNLLDIVNLMLTEPSFSPQSSFKLTPSVLRISCRLWHNQEGRAFEDTYLDPLCFMGDDDQYISKAEMLEAILKPLHMKIIQWDGVWWLMDIDSQYDNADYSYYEYNLAYSGWTSGANVDVVEDVLQLYELQTAPFENTRQVYNNAQLEYLPAWQGINIIQEFEQNTNALPVAANRSGNFYTGGQNTLGFQFLELGFPVNDVTVWNNWTNSETLASNAYYDQNSGQVDMKVSSGSDQYAEITFEMPGYSFNMINFNINLNTSTGTGLGFAISIAVTDGSGGSSRYLRNESFSSTSTDTPQPVWESYPTTFNYNASSADLPNWQLNFSHSNPFPTSTATKFVRVRINRPFTTYSTENIQPKGIINEVRLAIINNDWESSEYEYESAGIFDPVLINPSGSLPAFDESFTWGLSHPTLNNSHYFHLSSPYYSDGNPINQWLKTGSAGEAPDYKRILDWLLLAYFDDNNTYSHRLKASFKSNDITPLRVAQDYDGIIYKFAGGTFDDRMRIWECDYIEFKGIRNVPGQPTKGDFSPIDFNNDFFTEIP